MQIFTNNQQSFHTFIYEFKNQSTNLKDLGVELWEIKQFKNDIVTINQIKKSKSVPSTGQMQKSESSEIIKLAKQIKVYLEEDHLPICTLQIPIGQKFQVYSLALK